MVPKGWCYPSAHPGRASLLLLPLSTGPRQALTVFSQHKRTYLNVPTSSLSQGHELRNPYELRGRWFCPSTSPSWGHICNAASSSGALSTESTLIDLREQRVQRRPKKWLEGWNTSSVRKSQAGLLSLKKIRRQGELILAIQYLKGAYKKDGYKPYIRACCNRTRSNTFWKSLFRFNINKFFIMRVMKHWHIFLCGEMAGAPSLEMLHVRLHGAPSNLMQL